MDTVIATATAETSTPTVAAAVPAQCSVPSVEWMSHKFLHWGDECDSTFGIEYTVQRNKTLAPIAAAFFAGGEEAVIKAACGSNHCDIMRCWELAMTAVYGPSGIHESWTDEHDRPTAEAMAKFPRIREAVEGSRERLRSFLRVYG